MGDKLQASTVYTLQLLWRGRNDAKSQLCECSFQDSLRQKNWELEQIRKFPDTIGYMWTAVNDSNTLRVDAKIFATAKKYLRKKKFPDTCGHGLRGLMATWSLYHEIVLSVCLRIRRDTAKCMFSSFPVFRITNGAFSDLLQFIALCGDRHKGVARWWVGPGLPVTPLCKQTTYENASTLCLTQCASPPPPPPL